MALVRTVGQALVLPGTVSQFEWKYLARINRVALLTMLCHVPLLIGVAWANDTGPLLAAALASLGVVGPMLAYRFAQNPRSVGYVYGIAAMFFGALLVHFGRGVWTIEMHFYFFVALALLAVFANPMVIVTAAVTVAVHHFAFWFIAPSSVFNYDAPLSSVLVHAVFVIAESAAACFVARAFFDNVVGLETIVAARTEALDRRNRDMRLVFDHTQQGILTIDAEGRVVGEHSAAVEQWFGAPALHQPLWKHFSSLAPGFAAWLELGWDTVREGVFPRDVAFAQLPASFELSGRWYEVRYQPIEKDGQLEQALVLLSDVTDRHAREAADLVQRETMAMFEKVMRDRSAFLDFFAEAKRYVDELEADPPRHDVTTERRVLHTLKGNCALFGMSSVSEVCHAIETELQDRPGPMSADDRRTLGDAWKRSAARVLTFLGTAPVTTIELDSEDYGAILKAIDAGRPAKDVRAMVESWRHEPVKRRLERLGEQASQLAERLGKGPVEVVIDAQAVRLPREGFEPLWSSAIHLVRNAIDHGLTGTSQAPGRIELSARVEGGAIALHFKDNGRGIDWERVSHVAKQRNLSVGDAKALEAALFEDGLTTREEATEVSGRGVGLSAVKAAATKLGGTVEVVSTPGQGTDVAIRLPLPS